MRGGEIIAILYIAAGLIVLGLVIACVRKVLEDRLQDRFDDESDWPSIDHILSEVREGVPTDFIINSEERN